MFVDIRRFARESEPANLVVKKRTAKGSGIFFGNHKPSFLQHDSRQDILDQW